MYGIERRIGDGKIPYGCNGRFVLAGILVFRPSLMGSGTRVHDGISVWCGDQLADLLENG